MGKLFDADMCLKNAWQNFYKQEDEHEKNIDDYDRDMFPFKFSEKIWEKLVTMDVDLTFEELKEIIEDEEH